jgi:Cell division protein CrgA
MPESKGRQKPRPRRYQLEPQKRQPKKNSPRWYGPLVLAVMAIGVAVIILNYMALIPGTNDQTSSAWLGIGLGIIAVGFIGTMYWR